MKLLHILLVCGLALLVVGLLLLTRFVSVVVKPSQAAFPGEDGKIAVLESCDGSGQGTVHTVNPDGSGYQYLPLNSGLDHPSRVSWSPDGKHIAYSTGGGLYIANADGSGRQTIDWGDQPDWSPDGKKLVYVLSGELWIYDLDTLQKTQLTHKQVGSWYPPEYFPHTSYDYHRQPSWQPGPDGNEIVFTRSWDVDYDSVNYRQFNDLWAVNSDGTGLHQLTDVGDTIQENSPDPAIDDEPDWSPDGGQIAFRRATTADGNQVYTIGAEGGDPTRLTPVGGRGPPPGVVAGWAEDRLCYQLWVTLSGAHRRRRHDPVHIEYDLRS